MSHSRILELFQPGMSNSDVATEVGCNRSTAFRAKKRFVAAGLLETPPGKPSDANGTATPGTQRATQRRNRRLLHVAHPRKCNVQHSAIERPTGKPWGSCPLDRSRPFPVVRFSQKRTSLRMTAVQQGSHSSVRAYGIAHHRKSTR